MKWLNFDAEINSQSLEDTQFGHILQKYTLDKYTLENTKNWSKLWNLIKILKFWQNFEIWSKCWNLTLLIKNLNLKCQFFGNNRDPWKCIYPKCIFANPTCVSSKLCEFIPLTFCQFVGNKLSVREGIQKTNRFF